MHAEANNAAVFLHGFMQDGTTWDGVRAHLPQVRTVAPTLVPASQDTATLAALALQARDEIDTICDQAGCKRVVLVGYSLGGRVALEYARQWPETLAALVLESASLGPQSEERRSQLRTRNVAWAAQFAQAASMEEVVAFWESLPLFASQRSLPSSTQEQLRRARLRCNKDQLAWLLSGAGAHTMPLEQETCALLAALDVPVHYIAGAQDQTYAALARRLDQATSRVHTHLLDAGHNTHLECEGEFITLIQTIARSVA